MSRAIGSGPRLVLGCMRLSTERERDDARAISVLHAAFAAGITLLDTADAYCLDAHDVGHNERLIARAIATWPGDRAPIRVATKGGLTRPDGRWVADGRARHLVAACEASRRALGVERIHLYQLHAPDPRTPLATSVRALAALKEKGDIEAIGLCNVSVGQIEEARGIADIAAVQIELSVWQDDSLLNGVAEYCIAHDIALLAYRPVGGLKRRRRTGSDRVLADIAASHGATPFEIAIAWLLDLSDTVVPVAGATRVETVQSLVRATEVVLTGDDRARLDERFPAGRRLRPRSATGEALAARENNGEVVLIMGLPGAGKSTVAASYAAQGYERLNRDIAGGSLSDLLPELDAVIAAGASRIVLDNTYVSRKSRAGVIGTAAQRGLPVRCLWLSTSVEDAQVNAAARIVSRYGRLLQPEEIRKPPQPDTAVFGPAVQFRYQRDLEPPHPTEGFSHIDVMPFVRQRDASFRNKAIVLWCDGVLRRSQSGHRTPRSADDVEVLAGRREVLGRYAEEGWQLLALSWQPEIADDTMTVEDVEAGLARMRALLGVALEVEYCPHAGGPPICWCRKPLPGLGVVLIERHRLDPPQCIYVGSGPQDPGFARRLGFQYRDAEEFFGSAATGHAPGLVR
jgi:aryl-alcohol dehydrogenase-like predicted oxidoreductase/histidinol phosphatase-like enzyme/predicted kinase